MGCWRRMRRTDRPPARAGIPRVEVDRTSLSAAEDRSLLGRRCIDLLVADSLVGRSLGRVLGILAVVEDIRTEHRLEIGRSCVGEGSIAGRVRGRSSLVGIDCKGLTSRLGGGSVVARKVEDG